MCLLHTLNKLSSEGAAPSEWFRTYLSCKTRPDIAFGVGQLSRPNSDSGLGYLRVLRRVVWEKIYRPQRSQVSVGMLLLYGRSFRLLVKQETTYLVRFHWQRQTHSSWPWRYLDASLLKRDGLGRGRRYFVKRWPGDDESSLLSTKNPKAQDQTKHPVVQQITCARHSMEMNCMLPGYRAQTWWPKDLQRPSPLTPLKGTGPCWE